MSFKFRALLVLSALSLASCRGWVLEDRTGCPRLLFFDIENAGSFEAGTQVQVHAFTHLDGKPLREAATTVLDIQNRSFWVEVKSSQPVEGYAVIGGEMLEQREGDWTLPKGNSYAPLFRFSYLASVPEEYGVLPVAMSKEYAGVRLQFIGEGAPFGVVVRANTCGIRPDTGEPLTGAFEYRPQADSDGIYRFNLPRLLDNRLTLEWETGGGPAEKLDLYRILQDEGGITWKEPSLPDIGLVIDEIERCFEINVMPWEWQDLVYEY